MKRTIGVMLLIVFAGCSERYYYSHYHDRSNPSKVTVCHKGKNEIVIAPSAVDAHLNHGDWVGPCYRRGQMKDKDKHHGKKDSGKY